MAYRPYGHRSTTMHLYLTGTSFLNTIYTNDQGQPVYKVQTSCNGFGRTATITRILPKEIPRRGSGTQSTLASTPTLSESTGVADESPSSTHPAPSACADTDNSEDRFAHLAQIDWRAFAFSRIRFGGEEIVTKKFLRKVGYRYVESLIQCPRHPSSPSRFGLNEV